MLHFTYDPATKHWETIVVKDRSGNTIGQITDMQETDLKPPAPTVVKKSGPVGFHQAQATNKGMGNAYANLF